MNHGYGNAIGFAPRNNFLLQIVTALPMRRPYPSCFPPAKLLRPKLSNAEIVTEGSPGPDLWRLSR